MNVSYGAILNYSPRGKDIISTYSKEICGNIKAGKQDTINWVISRIINEGAEILAPFLNPDVVLVPIPGNAPLHPADAFWKTRYIAERFVSAGLGSRPDLCINRIRAVQKASLQHTADNRPSVGQHYDSLSATPSMYIPDQITLIDDVITQGRTSIACVQRLRDIYPNAEIRIFAVCRSRSFGPPIQAVVEPVVGTVSYNPNSGKTMRNDS